MKNRYTVRGNYVEIELNSKKHGKQITFISTEDLPLVASFPNTWYPKWSQHGRTFYVVGISALIVVGWAFGSEILKDLGWL